eukprot:CAMPEP_0171507438 /NCGR_PEP_ID=MMETSP0958-20121227/13528_1 /TAXON_ID=87120 /ORGANISM="Aurantiochytrium limacinum, Strain ATCCMYA-1381" /LENGTH=658 /DNA_ID=CAMNT_0012044193 /DNA_START=176 /DNA_END=2152 /DNA_ORIENTATION=-
MKAEAFVWTLLISVFGPVVTVAEPEFVDKIPNGRNVRAADGSAWPAVGHAEALGGGEHRNPFGNDFDDAGKIWTKLLCEMDSDGDGRSNGVELGDPYCEWMEGDTPFLTSGITNPGVANAFAEASSYCTNYEEPSGTLLLNVTMPNFTVPGGASPSIRYLFDELPSGTNYITRISALVDQIEIVLSMRIYVCEDTFAIRNSLSSPVQVDTLEGCGSTQLIYSWAIGGSSFCMPSEVGLEFNGTEHVFVLEIDYDNPYGRSSKVDSSGLSLYYSQSSDVDSSFQPAAWGYLAVDENALSIPPQASEYEVTVSEILPDSISNSGVQVIAVMNNANSLATKIWTSVTPANSSSNSFLSSCSSNYVAYLLQTEVVDTEITLDAGDRLDLHCQYNSASESSTIVGGEGSSNERCVGMFLYYPSTGLSLQITSSDIADSSGALELSYDSQLSCGSGPVFAASFSSWISGAPWQLGLHAMMMFVAWILLVPGATLMPVILKPLKGKTWFVSHRFTALLAVFLTLIGFLVIIVYKAGANFETTHGMSGLAVLVLVLMHIVLALLRPHPGEGYRNTWEWAHHLLGRTLMILGLVTVVLGIEEFELFNMPSDSADSLKIASVVISASAIAVSLVALGKRIWASIRGTSESLQQTPASNHADKTQISHT